MARLTEQDSAPASGSTTPRSAGDPRLCRGPGLAERLRGKHLTAATALVGGGGHVHGKIVIKL
ncbi:hypothetical protein [Amycolatopsis sacchari]|uniref:Uncharacterized protein n=1 Tax=Amycolatopsis sacchari TaxID=115433 RepID=A0A1I4CMQ1_9PSEU|nr:hypothetical protein [Amycolatopsis sacchari]SFK81211.1 hypothetical protein SAMN05421835_13534 [Amycolatopsis sacchari]